MKIAKGFAGIILAITILLVGAPILAHAKEIGNGETKVMVTQTPHVSSSTTTKLNVDLPSRVEVGKPVTFTMNAEGGTGTYQYALYRLDTYEDGELAMLVDISRNNNPKNDNTYTFTFYASGVYEIQFYATNSADFQNVPYEKRETVRSDLFTFRVQDPRYPSIEEKADKVANECLNTCLTDFDKAIWLHDWILDHIEYDTSYNFNPSAPAPFCSAESVFTERGKGTCESYHRAYSMLLKRVGIENGRVTGNGHVWTAVKMDGAWYQVDVTWDDDDGNKFKNRHQYFGLTDELISLAHPAHKTSSAESGYLYPSTALENNYFIKTGEITKWSNDFVADIQQGITDGKTSCTFPIPETANGKYNYDNYDTDIMYNLVAYQLSKQDWGGVAVSATYEKNSAGTVRNIVANFNDELQAIRITPPSKTVYETGDPTDRTGLTATAIYSSGTTKTLAANEYQVLGFDTSTAGNKTATVAYSGKTATFGYTVREKAVVPPNPTPIPQPTPEPAPTPQPTPTPEPTPTPSPAPVPESPEPVQVAYRTHVQDFGWQGFVKDGLMSGTSGQSKRLEGIEIKLDTTTNIGIQYTTHCQDYGWLSWSSSGEMNGTTGESKRLEAIKIQLFGADRNKYDIYYRVHAQNYGWLDWAKNGTAAGTAGYGLRLEGIQIVVVPKGESFNRNMGGIYSVNKAFMASIGGDPAVTGAEKVNVRYRTHVQDFGWQAWRWGGGLSGTSGQSKRLEGIELQLTNKQYPGGIEYRTHVQDFGWQGWRSDGVMSGTSGQSKRLEAIEIRLTGEMENHYDVYYRVHAQNFGWMGWAKNGSPAGTAGYSYRLEGIEVVLVPKGSLAPGSMVNAFRNK